MVSDCAWRTHIHTQTHTPTLKHSHFSHFKMCFYCWRAEATQYRGFPSLFLWYFMFFCCFASHCGRFVSLLVPDANKSTSYHLLSLVANQIPWGACAAPLPGPWPWGGIALLVQAAQQLTLFLTCLNSYCSTSARAESYYTDSCAWLKGISDFDLFIVLLCC